MAADAQTNEARLGKLEKTTAVLERDVSEIRNDINGLVNSQARFHQEWRDQKAQETKDRVAEAAARADEEKRRAERDRASRPTFQQNVQMISIAVGATVALISGVMFLIRSETGSVRQDLQALGAQTALQIRGQQDNITAAQSGLQSTQRDIGSMAVKLGLVEQRTQRNTDFLKQLEGYDAQMARQEERQKALAADVRALGRRLEKP